MFSTLHWEQEGDGVVAELYIRGTQQKHVLPALQSLITKQNRNAIESCCCSGTKCNKSSSKSHLDCAKNAAPC